TRAATSLAARKRKCESILTRESSDPGRCSRVVPLAVPSGTLSWTSSSSGASSWDSDRSPPRTGTPSPPGGSGSVVPDARTFWRMSPTQDEGIDLYEATGFSAESCCPKKKRVLYKCMWKECGARFTTCKDVEKHVRVKHLGRGDESEDSASSDHEEEFYYTESEEENVGEGEVEGDSSSGGTLLEESGESLPNIYTSSAPTLSHLDMARPPHEDPQYHVLTRVRCRRLHTAPRRRGANVAEDTGARAGTMLRVCRHVRLSIEMS
ncbi:unnamed protein product, partial [Ixodes persulcatus]